MGGFDGNPNPKKSHYRQYNGQGSEYGVTLWGRKLNLIGLVVNQFWTGKGKIMLAVNRTTPAKRLINLGRFFIFKDLGKINIQKKPLFYKGAIREL